MEVLYCLIAQTRIGMISSPFMSLLIIEESIYIFLMKRIIQVTTEVVSGTNACKIKTNIISPITCVRRQIRKCWLFHDKKPSFYFTFFKSAWKRKFSRKKWLCLELFTSVRVKLNEKQINSSLSFSIILEYSFLKYHFNNNYMCWSRFI